MICSRNDKFEKRYVREIICPSNDKFEEKNEYQNQQAQKLIFPTKNFKAYWYTLK